MNGGLNLETEGYEFVEVDPSGRYGRYNEILGKGASKIVYRAFDEYEGIEVAWNQVKLNDFLQSPEDLERLYCEIHLLKTLKHKNIMKFYTSWVDTANRNINFVTEMFTSGTLRQYRMKHRRVNIRAVKHWCRQILQGLVYLHSLDPPVIHRDLKCDNIFINGNQGEVKIGDLGLAAILRKSHAAHCVGTPEFMAPEVYNEEYNELVDIYSFGMCILEMITFEYPYSECTHHVQIYNKVISGKKPDALYRVQDPEVRQFIEKCLATVSLRLSARELLNDPFLQIDNFDNDLRLIDCRNECDDLGSLIRQPLLGHCPSDISYINGYSNAINMESYSDWGYQPLDMEATGIELFEHLEDDHTLDFDITIKGKKREDGSIFLRLRIADKDDRIRNIYFPFDTELDTALSVATEMVAELDITDQDVISIADMIDEEIAALVPDWKPGPGIEETPRSSNVKLCQNCASNHSSIGSFMRFLSNPGAQNSPPFHCTDGCAAAMHGRFEEITYQVDVSEHHGTEAQGHCHEELEKSDKPSAGKRENCTESKNPNERDPDRSSKQLTRVHAFSRVPSLKKAITDDEENKVQWELRANKAKYKLELREFRDNQLGLLLNFSSPRSCYGDQTDDKKMLLNQKSFRNSFTKDFQKSCPISGSQRARNSEAMEGSHRSNILKTAKNFFSGSLRSSSCQKTKSLPVDSVYVCNTKSIRYL